MKPWEWLDRPLFWLHATLATVEAQHVAEEEMRQLNAVMTQVAAEAGR